MKSALAIIGASVAVSAIAQTTPQQPSQQDLIRAAAGAVNRPLVYHVNGEDKVRVRKDITYRTDPDARADVYEPPNKVAGAKTPIVVLIHGSVPKVPVLPKDWGLFQGWGRLLAASGLVTVAFNHRLGYPNPFMIEADDDLARLLTYLRGHAADFGGDPERMCLASYSGGGPLLSRYIREQLPAVRCLVAFYSVLDIRDAEPHPKFMKPDQLAMFSPAVQVDAHAATMPPMFVMRAGHDRIPALNTWMETFLNTAIKRNAPITLMVHPTGAHGFENTTDDERSREIIKASITFMREHLRGSKVPEFQSSRVRRPEF